MTERLFRDYDLREEMEARKKHIAREISGLNTNYILNANIEELCAYFENKYRYEVPVLNTAETSFDQYFLGTRYPGLKPGLLSIVR